MNIFIKNMVCVRCKMAVQTVLENLDIPYKAVEMGRVEFLYPPSPDQYNAFSLGLLQYELEIMKDKKTILVERVKCILMEILQSDSEEHTLKLSVYLAGKLCYNYTYLANIFSISENMSIEQFYISKRIEKAKELMIYEELTLTEIAYRLKYSSVSHLCMQFKKVTGHLPSDFKKLCRSPENMSLGDNY